MVLTMDWKLAPPAEPKFKSNEGVSFPCLSKHLRIAIVKGKIIDRTDQQTYHIECLEFSSALIQGEGLGSASTRYARLC